MSQQVDGWALISKLISKPPEVPPEAKPKAVKTPRVNKKPQGSQPGER
jgi:hypothetical protein